MFISLLAIALTPIFLILWYIYVRDKYEKEPLSLCLKIALWGFLSFMPIVVIEMILDALDKSALWQSFVVAALTEEIFKFLVVYKFAYKEEEFNEPFDGIVYSVFASLGFAAIENVFYVLSGGVTVGITRMFTAAPAHAIFGVTMGYFLGLAKFNPEKKSNFYRAIIYPIALHGFYNYILMSGNYILLALFIPYLVFMYRYAFNLIKKHSDNSPFKGSQIDLNKMSENEIRDNFQ